MKPAFKIGQVCYDRQAKDPKQCQHMKPVGCHPTARNFMVIGPAAFERCKSEPVVIIYEENPGSDGLKGSMSLCEQHLKEFQASFPSDFATIKPIKKARGEA